MMIGKKLSSEKHKQANCLRTKLIRIVAIALDLAVNSCGKNKKINVNEKND
jgi:hypothetical protein